MKLLSPHSLTTFLHENLVNNSSILAYLIFSTHGTLLVHVSQSISDDQPLSLSTLRKFAAFGGTLYRQHDEGDTSRAENLGSMRILEQYKHDVEESVTLRVEMDNMLGIIEPINEGFLLGVLGHDDKQDLSDAEHSGSDELPVSEVLRLKAEGLAEVLKGEYPDKLPEDFY